VLKKRKKHFYEDSKDFRVIIFCEEKMLEYSVATKNNKIQKTEGDALKA